MRVGALYHTGGAARSAPGVAALYPHTREEASPGRSPPAPPSPSPAPRHCQTGTGSAPAGARPRPRRPLRTPAWRRGPLPPARRPPASGSPPGVARRAVPSRMGQASPARQCPGSTGDAKLGDARKVEVAQEGDASPPQCRAFPAQAGVRLHRTHPPQDTVRHQPQPHVGRPVAVRQRAEEGLGLAGLELDQAQPAPAIQCSTAS